MRLIYKAITNFRFEGPGGKHAGRAAPVSLKDAMPGATRSRKAGRTGPTAPRTDGACGSFGRITIAWVGQ
jgi:hypothetical protein